MTDIAIRVENLSKRYLIGHAQQRHDTLREAIVSAFKRADAARSSETIWALKDVSFEVKRGEVLGIIGRNGAGKSTLLKILSRITEPTEGRAIINGRVGSLLEVGTGFHPELTGRENIYLNGAILGMRRFEIERKFDEIVAFAEIEKFLDTPVKHYSSGMYVRLAFAVAAHLEPEILLVDEVLAVGDISFQRKCLGKMGEVAREGRTVLFVSHNMAAVENLCSKGIYLDLGSVVALGEVASAVAAYLSRANGIPNSSQKVSEVATLKLRTVSENGEEIGTIQAGDRLTICLDLAVRQPIRRPGIGVGIVDGLGARVVTFHTHFQYSAAWEIEKHCVCTIDWPASFLAPGLYGFVAALYDGHELISSWDGLGSLSVVASDYFGTGRLPDPTHQGRVLARANWRITADGLPIE